jgi:arsenite methyltransferase
MKTGERAMGTKGMSDEQVREAVRERYAASARSVLAAEPRAGCCGGGGCCGGYPIGLVDPVTRDLYDACEAPSQVALAASLGCGNPTALDRTYVR